MDVVRVRGQTERQSTMADDSETEEPSGTGEEVQLLLDMIQDRDNKLKQIEEKIVRHETKQKKLQEEVEKTREEASQQRNKNRDVVADFKRRRAERFLRLEQLENEVLQQNVALHLYTETMNKVSAETENVDPSYVVRIQAQLCKAMHSMGILEHQLSLVKDSTAIFVKKIKDGISGIVEDKSQMELRVMNQLLAVDNEKRSMEEDLKAQLQRERAELDKACSAGDENEATEEDDEDEDSDEEIDEDLLKEILEERREEIQQLEAENEKQRQAIEKLRAKSQVGSNGSVK